MTNKTASKIMNSNIPIVHEHCSIQDVQNKLLKKAKSFATINYIYLINDKKQFSGVISIKEVLQNNKKLSLKQISKTKNLVYVHTKTDQEKVAMLSLHHNLKAIPVVNKKLILLGVVDSDTILKVLNQELTEDTYLLSGITPEDKSITNISQISILNSIKTRLPWLCIGLLGGIITAKVVHSFEEILTQNIIIAAFIPLVVYLADAVGNQNQAFTIRALSIEPNFNFKTYFFKQATAVTTLATALCLILFLIGTLFIADAKIVITISLSLFIAILTSLITGTLIPFAFKKLKLDPANASGPIATILQDLTTVSLYFITASIVLKS